VRFSASGLNEKLDQDNKKKCHKLTASATHERAVRQQNGNNTTKNRWQTKPREMGLFVI
jgi:hypothetical protein